MIPHAKKPGSNRVKPVIISVSKMLLFPYSGDNYDSFGTKSACFYVLTDKLQYVIL